ncbi:MAG TPA: hypothetical protein VFS39_16730 [Nitrospira sp.]|nr:hypothetical protein [Nitrospira sp.]
MQGSVDQPFVRLDFEHDASREVQLRADVFFKWPGPDQGQVLLTVLMLTLILSVLGMTSLYLAGQDVPGISAMKDETTAQQLADAAAEVVVTWFHDPGATPPSVAGFLAKRQGSPTSGPSFFDTALRSQFVGTADYPDVLLDAANPLDNALLNTSPSGFPVALRGLGRLTTLKLYGPLRPGLLATVEVAASTAGSKPIGRTVQVQLGAVSIPAVRAAVEVAQGLGAVQPGGETSVRVHWGDMRIVGELVVKLLEHLPIKNTSAPVTGFPYNAGEQAQDRWSEYWVGDELTVTTPPPGQSFHPAPPSNIHVRQLPSPGLRLDQWDYETMKRLSLRHGTYYRMDRQGQLHSSQEIDGHTIRPSDVLMSRAIGDHRGLVFIDTEDGEPPTSEKMATLALDAGYLEAILVVQGHVVLRPNGEGLSLPVLTPAPDGGTALGARIPIQLSGVHFQGVLVCAGKVSVERSVRMFGAVMSGETIFTSGSSSSLEVWYNADLAKGLFRGLPVVYRVPGTWRML